MNWQYPHKHWFHSAWIAGGMSDMSRLDSLLLAVWSSNACDGLVCCLRSNETIGSGPSIRSQPLRIGPGHQWSTQSKRDFSCSQRRPNRTLRSVGAGSWMETFVRQSGPPKIPIGFEGSVRVDSHVECTNRGLAYKEPSTNSTYRCSFLR